MWPCTRYIIYPTKVFVVHTYINIKIYHYIWIGHGTWVNFVETTPIVKTIIIKKLIEKQ